MKLAIQYWLLFIVCLASCQSRESKKLLSVDVTSSFPTKKISLQDIGEVKYVPLETTDDFITQGLVEDIGEKYIIVRNSASDGDIFIFTTTGKAVRKINHKGQGAEDYLRINSLILDESNNEFFVYDSRQHKILIYNISGAYKRTLHPNDSTHYEDMSEYDSQHLIAYKRASFLNEDENTCYVLLDKNSGKVTQEIKLPIEKYESIIYMSDNLIAIPMYKYFSTLHNGFLLSSPSSDTIYRYRNENLEPIMVRKPSIHDMEVKTFLYPLADSKKYLFMQSYEKKYDVKNKRGFDYANYVYDKNEDMFYTPDITNPDLGDDYRFQFMPNENISNREIISYKSLEPSLFLEASEEGQLGENLKEMVSSLNDESNNIIMILSRR